MISANLEKALHKVRSEALAAGATHYFTSLPCVHGHIDKRASKSGHCSECTRVRQKHRLTTDVEYRKKHSEWNLKYITKRLADPVERKRITDRAKEVRNAKPETKIKTAILDQIRNQREDVKVRRRVVQKIRYAEKLKDDVIHIAARRERSAKWARENKDRANAKTALRRAARQQATPPWLTDEMKVEMQNFYVTAQLVVRLTGIQHDVDHIIPLSGETVCGLHVPWNLQILQATVNRAKHNKLEVFE